MSSSAPLRPHARGLVTGRMVAVLVLVGAAATAWALLGRQPSMHAPAPASSASVSGGDGSQVPPAPSVAFASKPAATQPEPVKGQPAQAQPAQANPAQPVAEPASPPGPDLSRHLSASAELSVRKLTAPAASNTSAGIMPALPKAVTATTSTSETLRPEGAAPRQIQVGASSPPSDPIQAQPAPAPQPPAVVAPTPRLTGPAGGADNPPSFDIVRVDPHGSAVLAGRSRAGARIVIADNGRPIAQAQADAHGQWVALPAAPLPTGGQQLTLATLPAHPGEAVQATAAPVIVLVPEAKTTVPGDAPGALALLTPTTGMPRLLQAPAFPGGSRLQLGIVDYDAHGAIRFSGTAPPHSSVRVYIDRHAAGDAAVDAQGRWTLVPAAPVSEGRHQLRTDQLARNGTVAARIALPFERVVLPNISLLDGKIIVQPGESLWRIARNVYGQGVRYTVIYVANRSQIRNPDLIYPGQVFAVPAASADIAPTPASAWSSTSK